MNQQQQMNCPNCNNLIVYDTYGLLQGRKFACTVCNATIGLSPQSHDSVQNAMDGYEKLKASIAQQKPE